MAVIATAAVPVWAATTTKFKDVPSNHWAAQAIAKATQTGVIRPPAKGTFRPDQPVTRAELAAILVRAIDYLESRGPVKISSSPAKPDVIPQQLAALAKFPPQHPAHANLSRLVKGGYLPPDHEGKGFLPTPANINQPASAEEVASGVAGVMIRVTEKRTALESPETLQEGERPETREQELKGRT
jgi:hypothetical protein